MLDVENAMIGDPGPALPWYESGENEWCRRLAGSERLVAMVGECEEGDGYFYCVGDGAGPPEEVSNLDLDIPDFATAEAARVAADEQLLKMGYTFAVIS